MGLHRPFLPLSRRKLRKILQSNTFTHSVWGSSLRHSQKRCPRKSLAAGPATQGAVIIEDPHLTLKGVVMFSGVVMYEAQLISTGVRMLPALPAMGNGKNPRTLRPVIFRPVPQLLGAHQAILLAAPQGKADPVLGAAIFISCVFTSDH